MLDGVYVRSGTYIVVEAAETWQQRRKVITCRQRDVREMVTGQGAGQRFRTAISFSIDFAAGSVLVSLHEYWIACGLIITQTRARLIFILLLAFSAFQLFSYYSFFGLVT